VAALHHTTTDVLEVLERDEVAVAHRRALRDAEILWGQAREAALAERAARLGIEGDTQALDADVARRASDWAEVRPEWGLAGNAGFIVAPRSRSRGFDFAGRVFLHDYIAEQDPDFTVLELIMTAPMVVTHWINMQYFASTTDPWRFGCGDKVLHNVVGGRLGVFEGNGGDLRIGLPLQSVHDGRRFVHEALRLTVFIEAPAAAIDRIIAKHDVVRQLIEGEWIHLIRIDTETGACAQRGAAGWRDWTRDANEGVVRA
jgi:uncharacterized protein YbcC (UPF0753/DUF2309 family)